MASGTGDAHWIGAVQVIKQLSHVGPRPLPPEVLISGKQADRGVRTGAPAGFRLPELVHYALVTYCNYWIFQEENKIRNALVSLFTRRRHRGPRHIGSPSSALSARVPVRNGNIDVSGSHGTRRPTVRRPAAYTSPVYSPYPRTSGAAAGTPLFRVT